MKRNLVKVDSKKWDLIKRQLRVLDNAFTLIGIQEGSDTPGGTSLALIAAANEFGTKNGHIPERPWQRGWFDANRKRIEKFASNLYTRVLKGNITADRALKILGEWYTGELKKSVTQLKTPPNAPSTIQKKKSSNPLIDTGYMRNSITHKEMYNVSPSLIRTGNL